MNQPKVTIIIPIYNVELYLRKCIESIINQSLKDIEIICINDNSKDSCQTILEEYASKDSRIKVIHNKINIGQGLSRNKALHIAQGKYVGFVDGDDWVEPEMYEQMYAKAEEFYSDIVGCDYLYRDMQGNIIRKDTNPYPANAELRNNLIKRCFGEKKGDPARGVFVSTRSCCNKIYKVSFLTEHYIEFNSEKQLFSEDWLFNTKVLLNCKQATWIHRPFYHYIKRSTSFMNHYREHYLSKRLIFQEHLKQLLFQSNQPNNEELIARLDMDLFSFSFAYVANEKKLGGWNGFKAILGIGAIPELRVLFNKLNTTALPYYPNMKRNLIKYLIYWLVKVSIFLFDKIHFLNKKGTNKI